MNLSKLSTVLICTLFFFTSCENTEILFPENNNTPIEEGSLKFRYKNKDYYSEYQKVGDDILFKEGLVADLANKLSKKADLAIFIHGNGIIEYFDNQQDLKESLFKITKSSQTFDLPATRSATLTIYEDSKCKGDRISYTIDDNRYSVEVYQLDERMDDKISSIALESEVYTPQPNPYPPIVGHGPRCVASFFEHPNFEGYSIWFDVYPGYPNSYVHYFKSIPLYPGSSKNWNDRVTSLKFSFARFL